MFAPKKELRERELQDTVFSEALRSALNEILGNTFFKALEATPISKEGYQRLVKEKYSAVGYFIPLLENAEKLAEPVSPELAQVFRQNKHDETGYFASAYHEEYAHATWRARSLSTFGINGPIVDGSVLDSTRRHNDLMSSVAESPDAYQVFGALLFLELFVVYEMKHLIRGFERDMPELFPKDGYSYDKFPFNTHEYWYGHALHDTWHYRQIEEKLKSALMDVRPDDTRLTSLLAGIQKTKEAKEMLYSKELTKTIRL